MSTDEGERLAREVNVPFFETSAKDNKNVTEAFCAVTKLALQQRLRSISAANSSEHHRSGNGATHNHSIHLKHSKKKDKKHHESCCK